MVFTLMLQNSDVELSYLNTEDDSSFRAAVSAVARDGGSAAQQEPDGPAQTSAMRKTGRGLLLGREDSTGSDSSSGHVKRHKHEAYQPSEQQIACLTGMGFEYSAAVRSLKISNGNTERAANQLLSS